MTRVTGRRAASAPAGVEDWPEEKIESGTTARHTNAYLRRGMAPPWIQELLVIGTRLLPRERATQGLLRGDRDPIRYRHPSGGICIGGCRLGRRRWLEAGAGAGDRRSAGSG